ncbi:hypothetical protein GCM10008995_18390 [Halobellus salinus]|uniref:Uncharacterized protein n=1 Tax=Halobellus salinus TaxID=931585 RepID=A0A830EGY0_9EURY|nr:hypothetical protein [Halobellus salinus]GGJ08840.1 hypothetical protein GCM10008995_18390 [Halobellus salinus]SMP27020.1 hypothetical protein SAMN06265347_11211 [Halobellus salinus]
MRLADDNRARVPFALIGVLLLVGSATFAASLSTRGPGPVDKSADAAAERVDAETTAALRTAVRDAARAAARDPVTVAAEDGPGSALVGPNTFRRYLRLRIFLSARDAVTPVEHRRGDAVARVSLGGSVDTVSEAIDRVSVSGVDGGTELRATVRGLVLRVERDGRVVDTRRLNRTVTVAVPTLALHDRTTAFQKRLDAGPLESPGLARRMTVGLTAVAQARGLGQYAGLPISNVVATHHVSLSTNAGLLDAQRAAFGRTDPDAAAGVRAATLRTGATDLLSPHADSQVVSAVTGELPDPNAPERAAGGGSGALPATRTVSVSVNGTADAAFLSLLRGENGESLESIRQNGYGADISVGADRRTITSGDRPGPDPPGENWTLAYASVSTTVSVAGGGSARPVEPVGVGERLLYRATRRVVERHTVQRTWVKPNISARTTAASWRDTHRVRVTATARLDDSRAPSRPVRPAFESGGVLDGPNLRDANAAARTVVSGLGGADGIARNAVTGGRTSASTSVAGDRPDGLDPWIYKDLTGLRERVRNISVTVAASDAATGGDNGAARLAAAVRDRRAELVDAPREYHGVADRSRVAARVAYLDRVLARLDSRAGRTDDRNDGIGRALDAAGITPERANELADLTPEPPTPRATVGSDTGVRGTTVFIPDGDPAYLSSGAVDGRLVDGIADDEQYVGLAVRNLNVFAIPYGDTADLVTRTLLGDPGRVSLHTAGGALVAADRTLAEHPDPTLRSRRDALEPNVERSMRAVRHTAIESLARETSLTTEQRRNAVDRAFSQWDTPGERALAATDGSLARATAEAAVAEVSTHGGDSDVVKDRLRTALRVDLRRVATAKRVRVPEDAVDGVVSERRKIVERETNNLAENATEVAIERGSKGKVGGVPAGLPISPSLSPWVATVNVWVIESKGAYGRFAVHTESGSTTYVRDGQQVGLDVDGDSVAEPMGRSKRIEFSVRTVSVVAVPSGGLGVGDTDGNADERSVAWRDPKPGPRCVTPTGECSRE